jgi:hypothetical protein
LELVRLLLLLHAPSPRIDPKPFFFFFHRFFKRSPNPNPGRLENKHHRTAASVTLAAARTCTRERPRIPSSCKVPARFSEADCEFSGLQQKKKKKKKKTSLSLLCFLLLFL